MNGVPGAGGLAVEQNVQAGGMTEPESVPGADLPDPLQVGAPNHQVQITGQGGMLGIGFFHVHQNRQSADQLMRHTLGHQRTGDFVQNTGQIEQALFEHEINSFSAIRGVVQKLRKGEHSSA